MHELTLFIDALQYYTSALS